MPTQTNPRLLFVARELDSPTTSLPAVRPTSPSPADGPSIAVAPQRVEEAVVPDGTTAEPYPDEWATANLSPLAAILHSGCGCAWAGDVEAHGVDFEDFAARVRESILAEAPGGIVTVPVSTKAPVETKVAVGGWTSLAVGMALALANLLLARLDLIPSLLGGDSPWVGALVLVLGATLPAAIAHLKMYYAPHSPRVDVEALVEKLTRR